MGNFWYSLDMESIAGGVNKINLIKIEGFGTRAFSIEKSIDGLKYDFSMSTHLEKEGLWEIIFEVENSMTVANRGVDSMVKVGNSIVEIVKKVSEVDDVKTVVMHASSENMYLGEVASFQKIVTDKMVENPKIFDGFHFKRTGEIGSWMDELIIENGNITIISFGDTEKFPVQKLVGDKYLLGDILKDVDLRTQFSMHIGIDVKPAEVGSKRDKSKQRATFFERTLREGFPEALVERKNNSVFLHLK